MIINFFPEELRQGALLNDAEEYVGSIVKNYKFLEELNGCALGCKWIWFVVSKLGGVNLVFFWILVDNPVIPEGTGSSKF